MTKKLTDLPINALTEIMSHLDLKSAVALGSTSQQPSAALEVVHPKTQRYLGPPDYTKAKGKYQKEYDGLEDTMGKLVDMNVHLTLKKSMRLHQQYILHKRALQAAKRAYGKGKLTQTIRIYWKKAVTLKEVFNGLVRQLKTMGEKYEKAVVMLKKKTKDRDESQAHKIMDGLVKYLPQFDAFK